jgi:hypothetical protein
MRRWLQVLSAVLLAQLAWSNSQAAEEWLLGEAAGWVWPLVVAVIIAALVVWYWLHTHKMRTVFVSYRRSDSAQATAQIVAALRDHFGSGRVFHDVASIKPGENFRHAIARTLYRCDAALVVIGPTWESCVGESGERRLTRDDDVVHMEVASALESGALTIPILVEAAEMPQADRLPEDLHALSDHNAVNLRGDNQSELAAQLAAAVQAAPVRRTPLFLGLCHLDILVVLMVFFAVDGMTFSELSTALAIVMPALAAVVAVALIQRWGSDREPVRITRVATGSLWIPLGFVALIACLVLMKALNLGFGSFEDFKLALAATEVLFAGYTGIELASLQTQRKVS